MEDKKDEEQLLVEVFNKAETALVLKEDFLDNAKDALRTTRTTEEARKQLRVIIHHFIALHPELGGLKILSYVNAVVGDTSAGKDKLAAAVFMLDFAVSRDDITTRGVDFIIQAADKSVPDGKTLYTLIDSLGHATDYNEIVDATRARAALHANINGFNLDKPITLQIRCGKEDTPNVTMHNLPGTVARGTAQAEGLFQGLNAYLNDLARRDGGTIFVATRANSDPANEVWTDFDVVKHHQDKHHQGKLVFVITCGDLMNIPRDLASWAAAEQYFFGGIRRIVPDAKCFIVANSNDNNLGVFARGQQRAEEDLAERLRHLERTIKTNNPSETDENKNKFMERVGIDKVRRLFWQMAAEKTVEPFKLLIKSLANTMTAALAKCESNLVGLDESCVPDWAELLRKFSFDFFEVLPKFVQGVVIPGETFQTCAKQTMQTASEEYIRMVERLDKPMFDENKWKQILEDEEIEDGLNTNQHYTFRMREKRFWGNLLMLLDDFKFGEEDWPMINASIQSDAQSGTQSRSSAYITCLKGKIAKALSKVAEHVPVYISYLATLVSALTANYLFLLDPTLQRNEEVLEGITATFDGYFLKDMCEFMQRRIENRIEELNHAVIKLDIHGLMELLTGEDHNWHGLEKEKVLLGAAEASESAANTLDHDDYQKMMTELNARFKLLLMAHVNDIQTTLVPHVLRKFGVFEPTHMTAEVFYKHLLLNMPGYSAKRAFEAVVQGKIKCATDFRKGGEEQAHLTVDRQLWLRPPAIMRQDVVKRYNLTGLVESFRAEDPRVFGKAYFLPLDPKAVINIGEDVNLALKDTTGKKRQLLAETRQLVGKAKAISELVQVANEFLEKHFQVGQLVKLRTTEQDVLAMSTQLEQIAQELPADDF